MAATMLTVSTVEAAFLADLPQRKINLAGFVRQAMERFHVLQQVNDAIESTPDIMQGAAVFKGPRVPVGLVLGFLRQGDTLEALKQDYPFLTPELIELARVYEALHPQRGRPRTLARQFPAWQVEHKAIRPAAHA